MHMQRQQIIKQAKKIVIKLGTSLLTDEPQTTTAKNLGINVNRVRSLMRDIVNLIDKGKEIIIVTSGAIGVGSRLLGLEQKPVEIPLKQAAAALGQISLMNIYQSSFAEFSQLKVAQVLLTQDVVDNRAQFLNARNTIFKLLEYHIVPIINENDTVAIQEIRIGDNDNLAAIVADLIDADVVLNLSTIEGLYDYQGEIQKLVREVREITPEIKALIRKEQTRFGTGGMATKISAAEKITTRGGAMIIASGLQEGIISRIFLDNEDHGTIFYPKNQKISPKHCWIAFTKSSRGLITIDAGAAQAVMEKGTSLLPIGIVAAEGKFEAGDMVKLQDHKQVELARGLVNYSLAEVLKIKGKKSGDISKILGADRVYEEVIHRDNLVLTHGRRNKC